MSKSLLWARYAADYVLRQKFPGYKKAYCKRNYVSNEDASLVIAKKLQENRPFAAGRIGLFEMAAMRMYEFEKKNKYEKVMDNIYNCAGFFPRDVALGSRFLEIMKASLKEMDVLGSDEQMCENYFINTYGDKGLTVSRNMELYHICGLKNPWTAALSGKKVLVVTPFTESVKLQYEKRELLYPGTEILPAFTLSTYKSLLTIGDLRDTRFQNWFEALAYMRDEILSLDFDVALLGCGAYGFPLAAEIKKAGKQAVHMGGNLQILFGIMGKRWDGTRPGQTMNPDIKRFYNEHWIYPIESRPKDADKVEYGPYWK